MSAQSRKPRSRITKRPNARLRREAAPPRLKNLLGDEMHEYSQGDLTRLFGLPASLTSALADSGFITETAVEGKTGYSFQDLLTLRTTGALKAAKIAHRKIVTALGLIRSSLPPGSLLTTLALAAAEDASGVEGVQAWEVPSERKPPAPRDVGGSAARRISTSRSRPLLHVQAEAHYTRGHALEETDVAAARAAYLDALNAHSDHLEARINLGRLLHLAGELKEAEKVYRAAKSSSALLSFNLAILLEDLNREEEAVAAYREALAQDPSLHDAHFNLSRLHERAKQPKDAFRHLLAYRRHIARRDSL
jgi:tetratricopeptide (TPR) repeat protein